MLKNDYDSSGAVKTAGGIDGFVAEAIVNKWDTTSATVTGNYLSLPNGFLMQWGVSQVPRNVNYTLNYPVPYTSSPFAYATVVGNLCRVYTGSPGLTSVTLTHDSANATAYISWLIVGKRTL